MTITNKSYFILVCIVFIGFSFHGVGQIKFNPATVVFGNVTYPQSQIEQVWLVNTAEVNIAFTVDSVVSLTHYADQVFTVTPSSFSVNANDSILLEITFTPEHNILYNSELLFYANSAGTLSIDVKGQGKFSSWYASTDNKSEEDLKAALKALLSSTLVAGTYNTARDEMFMVIDNKKVNGQGATVNTAECVYTGVLATNYADRTAAQNQGFNTEHTFPQSLFSQNLPMRADLHHLFVTDDYANNQRSNYPFGVVTNPTWQDGGSKLGGGKFEPRDWDKGRVARAMMYFVTAYQDYSSYFAPQESILRQWNASFPVDNIDIDRNEGIFNFQHNRNPFIDYPQYLERIQVLSGNSVAPIQHSYLFDAALYSFDAKSNNEASLKPEFSLVNSGTDNVIVTNLRVGSSQTNSNGNLAANAYTYPITLLPGESFTFHLEVLNPLVAPGFVNDTVVISLGNPDNTELVKLIDYQIDQYETVAEVNLNFEHSYYQHTHSLSADYLFEYQVSTIQGQLIEQSARQVNELNFNCPSKGVYLFTAKTPLATNTYKLVCE